MPTAVDRLFDHVKSLPRTSRGSDTLGNGSGDDFGPEMVVLDKSALKPMDTLFDGELAVEDARRLDGAVCFVGFDALAFYKSRRYINDGPCKGHWGIFYLQPGIQYLADLIKTQPNVQDANASAIAFLRAHELFHYRFDLHTLFVEAARGEQIYEKLKDLVKRFRSHQVEEALANRNAWEWAKRNKLGRFAKDFMKSQPNAYKRFDEDRVKLAAELAANLHKFDFAPDAASNELGPWTGHVPAELWKHECPEYLVTGPQTRDWLNRFDSTWVNSVREIDESPQFTKRLRKCPDLEQPWIEAKEKLTSGGSISRGLDFKPFRRPNVYSVRLDIKRRAHLQMLGSGRWLAIDIGGHTEMGHG
jgi:hypothetical protein